MLFDGRIIGGGETFELASSSSEYTAIECRFPVQVLGVVSYIVQAKMLPRSFSNLLASLHCLTYYVLLKSQYTV